LTAALAAATVCGNSNNGSNKSNANQGWCRDPRAERLLLLLWLLRMLVHKLSLLLWLLRECNGNVTGYYIMARA
jgi:hypothetical protein